MSEWDHAVELTWSLDRLSPRCTVGGCGEAAEYTLTLRYCNCGSHAASDGCAAGADEPSYSTVCARHAVVPRSWASLERIETYSQRL